VCEAALGSSLLEVVDAAGGATAAVGAVLVGGYHGAWLPAGPGARLPDLQLSNGTLRPAGAGLGAGVVTVLAAERCGLVETARVASYLAGESARQCGPCLNGLPRLAEVFADLASPGTTPAAAGEVRRLAGLVERRGACHHPDGTARLVRSALRTFAGEVHLHVRGRCSGTDPRPVLPTAAAPTGNSARR
jgi:NADH:ubiquinone oxidoreductase subunit F (NADH-binding)